MTNRAAWAYVAGEVRSFSAEDYPVLMGLHRLLAWAQREFGNDPRRNCRGPGKREVISVTTAGRNSGSAGKSKNAGAAGSTLGAKAPSAPRPSYVLERVRALRSRRSSEQLARTGSRVHGVAVAPAVHAGPERPLTCPLPDGTSPR